MEKPTLPILPPLHLTSSSSSDPLLLVLATTRPESLHAIVEKELTQRRQDAVRAPDAQSLKAWAVALEALPPGDWHVHPGAKIGHGSIRYTTLGGDYATTMLALAAEWSDIPSRAASVLDRMLSVMGRDESLAETRRRDANLVGNGAYYRALSQWLHASPGDETIGGLLHTLTATLTREDEKDAMKGTLSLLEARAAQWKAQHWTTLLETMAARGEATGGEEAARRHADLQWMTAQEWAKAGNKPAHERLMQERQSFFGHVYKTKGWNVHYRGEGQPDVKAIEQAWSSFIAQHTPAPKHATSSSPSILPRLDWGDEVRALQTLFRPAMQGVVPGIPRSILPEGASLRWVALIRYLRAPAPSLTQPNPLLLAKRRELRRGMAMAWAWNDEDVQQLDEAVKQVIQEEEAGKVSGPTLWQRTVSLISPNLATHAPPTGPISFEEWREQKPSFSQVVERRLIPMGESTLVKWFPVPVLSNKTAFLTYLARYSPEEWHQLGLTARCLTQLRVNAAAVTRANLAAPWDSLKRIEEGLKGTKGGT
jgi:hypothetical protein